MKLHRYSYKKITRIGLGFSLAVRCLLCLLLAACTKADIHYPVLYSGEGFVRIYPDSCGFDLPVLQYYFYNIDDRQGHVVRRYDSDRSGNFEGRLPSDDYQVIATNTGAGNVAFTGMGDYWRATVRVPIVETRPGVTSDSPSLIYLAQPDTVYSVVISQLSVVRGDTVFREPAVVLLTKRLNLIFRLYGGLVDEVSALDGVLHGVYPSLSLWSRTCAEGEATPLPDTVVGFGTGGQGAQREVQINLLGLFDPDYGRVYTNLLPFELRMSDGSREDFTVDLTEVLSDAISRNQGAMPGELTVYIDVRRIELGGVGIVPWIPDEQPADLDIGGVD